jgi:hypothetical protein
VKIIFLQKRYDKRKLKISLIKFLIKIKEKNYFILIYYNNYMDIVQTIDYNVDNILTDYIKKPTLIRGIIHLVLILYAARIAPSLPKPVLELFENQYFKLFVFSLILWTAQFSPSTSILIAIAFMITVNYANQKPLWEFLENVVEDSAVVTVKPDDSVQAVLKLADAAAMPTAQPVAEISDLATIAASNVTDAKGADAVQKLAEQAVVAEAGQPSKIEEAVKTAVVSISESAAAPAPAPAAAPAPAPAPPPAPAAVEPKGLVQEPAGCYPMRNYDMSKVSPQSTASSFEDYEEWKA